MKTFFHVSYAMYEGYDNDFVMRNTYFDKFNVIIIHLKILMLRYFKHKAKIL